MTDRQRLTGECDGRLMMTMTQSKPAPGLRINRSTKFIGKVQRRSPVHTSVVYKNSEFEVNPLLCFQELTNKRSDVTTPRRRVDESSCCIHNRLDQPKKVLGDACKCRISIVQTTKNKRRSQRLDHGSGHWTANWRRTEKQVDTDFVTWDRIETSESMRIPRSRTIVDGTTKSAPTRIGVRGNWWSRRLVANHTGSLSSTSSAVEWFERIHPATSSMRCASAVQGWRMVNRNHRVESCRRKDKGTDHGSLWSSASHQSTWGTL